MRINNLEFRTCSYLFEPPEHIGYEICKWEPNPYYKKESEFIEDGDYYRPNDTKYSFVSISKDCFKNPETCYQIASWDWCIEEYYIFSFCSDRPLKLTDSEWEDFIKLIKYGFKQLDDPDDE